MSLGKLDIREQNCQSRRKKEKEIAGRGKILNKVKEDKALIY
jgi:hypothetical protein